MVYLRYHGYNGYKAFLTVFIKDRYPVWKQFTRKGHYKSRGREWLVVSYEPEEFGVTNPDDINWMRTRLSPMLWHTHDQPIRITNPEAKSLAKSHISCTEFGKSQFKAQNSTAGWDYPINERT